MEAACANSAFKKDCRTEKGMMAEGHAIKGVVELSYDRGLLGVREWEIGSAAYLIK